MHLVPQARLAGEVLSVKNYLILKSQQDFPSKNDLCLQMNSFSLSPGSLSALAMVAGWL